MLPTLNIQNLSFARLDRYFIKDLNIQLLPGEILQILGENGSGKSTLLRILAGLIEPTDGTVYWENRCIFKNDTDYKNVLRYLSDRNALKSYLTVEENLKLVIALGSTESNYLATSQLCHSREGGNPFGIDSRLRGNDRKEQVVERRECNIKHLLKKEVQYLSLGQRRRISFTKILLNPGKIWILDEPMTGLDKKGQEWLNTSLEKHLNANGIIIIATHQPLLLKNTIKTIQLGDISLA